MAFSAYVCEPFYRGTVEGAPSYLLKCISAGGIGKFTSFFVNFLLLHPCFTCRVEIRVSLYLTWPAL